MVKRKGKGKPSFRTKKQARKHGHITCGTGKFQVKKTKEGYTVYRR